MKIYSLRFVRNLFTKPRVTISITKNTKPNTNVLNLKQRKSELKVNSCLPSTPRCNDSHVCEEHHSQEHESRGQHTAQDQQLFPLSFRVQTVQVL